MSSSDTDVKPVTYRIRPYYGSIGADVSAYSCTEWEVSLLTEYPRCPCCGHQKKTSARSLGFFPRREDAVAYAESLAGPNDTIDNHGRRVSRTGIRGKKEVS